MIFYITTHDKNLSAAKIIKEYFDNFNLKYFFVYGKGCSNPIKPYIEVDCEDCYEQLPLKTYFITKHFIELDEQYMIKLDDDTFLDLEKLKNIKEDYVGIFRTHPDSIKNSIYHWYKITNDEFKTPKKSIHGLIYAEGACYCLSKKAALQVYSKGFNFYLNTPTTYLGEDVKVGIALSELDITKKDIKSNEQLPYEIAEDFLFVHPVHPILFKKLLRTTNEQKRQILASYNILNANVLREQYLTNMLNQVELEKCK